MAKVALKKIWRKTHFTNIKRMWKFNLKFFLVEIHFSSSSLFIDFVLLLLLCWWCSFYINFTILERAWVSLLIIQVRPTLKVLDSFHFRNKLVDIVMRVNVHCSMLFLILLVLLPFKLFKIIWTM